MNVKQAAVIQIVMMTVNIAEITPRAGALVAYMKKKVGRDQKEENKTNCKPSLLEAIVRRDDDFKNTGKDRLPDCH